MNGSVGGIVAGLRNCEARPEGADVILSTAHKAKGAQRRTVKLSEEFQNVWEAAKVIDKDNEAGVRLRPMAKTWRFNMSPLPGRRDCWRTEVS